MATIVKRKLTGSTDGLSILVGTATGTAATTIHTAVAGTVAGSFDEVWLYAYNGHTSSVVTTIQYGGTATPNNDITVTIANKSGLMLVVPGLVLQNGSVVRAYAATNNVVTLNGFVNSITDA
jgi:hypothetical protein